MDLSDRLPIWPPPRNPSTFLAPQWCSAAKGAWVRVECLPLKPPIPPQEINGNPLSWRQRKSCQTVVGYISLKPKEWRACPNCERFLTFKTIAFYLFRDFFRMAPDYWGESQKWLTKLWPKILLTFPYPIPPLTSPLLYPPLCFISTLPKPPLPHSPSLPLPTVWPKLRLDLNQDHRHLRKINLIVSEFFTVGS